jgi:hypothetical protein
MNKYEKLIEYIINENEQKARELFHEIVVEKSRDIYESIMDEEQMAEMGGDQQQGLADEIQADENGGVVEGDDEEFDLGDEGEHDMGDEGEHDMGDMDDDSAPATKGDIADLESQLDDLKAMFASQEDSESDLDGEDEFGGPTGEDEPGMEAPEEIGAHHNEPPFGESTEGSGMMEGENPFAKKDSGSGSGSGSGAKGSGVKEAKSVAQLMREYVDQIGQVYDQEPAKGPNGHMAGTGAKSEKQGERNTKSVSLDKGPDFGGTSANILNKKGATNETPDGKAIPKPNNEYSKGEGKFSNEKFQNAPGGSKKTSPVGQNWEKEHGAEGQTTDGKVKVATKSVQVQNTGK